MVIENSVIENILDNEIKQKHEKRSRVFNRITGHYEEKRKQLSFDISAAQKLSKTSFKQAKSLQAGIEILLQRRAAFYQRSEDLASLVQKGIASKTQEQIQFDEILSIDGQVNSKRGQLISLNNQNQQAELTIKQLKSKFRLSLFSQLQNNKARLSDLKRQSTTLEDEVSSSVIMSPISGTVIFLGYDTNGMYVERGETHVTLSQILSEPKVQLIIPTQAIDQVSVGMVGKLTIPNLPQRNLPPIRVKVISISPNATKDADGLAIGYAAQASIIKADLQKATTNLEGNLHLATDMPVNIALEGRKITFSEYLIGPFFSIFKGSLQD